MDLILIESGIWDEDEGRRREALLVSEISTGIGLRGNGTASSTDFSIRIYQREKWTVAYR